MTVKTFLILFLFLLSGLFVFSLHAESPFRQEYIVTSEYHSTTGKGGERRNKLHEGIDLWSVDPIIFPALNGTVVKVDWDDIFGKNVIIRHFSDIGNGEEEFFTLYAHGSTIYYSAVGIVTTDIPIMKMGSTGYSSGPHLHFAAFRVVDGDRVYFDTGEILGL